MKISDLTDAQMKTLRDRMSSLGQAKLIDRLENEMINARMQDKEKKAERLEVSINWVRRQTGWVTT